MRGASFGITSVRQTHDHLCASYSLTLENWHIVPGMSWIGLGWQQKRCSTCYSPWPKRRCLAPNPTMTTATTAATTKSLSSVACRHHAPCPHHRPTSSTAVERQSCCRRSIREGTSQRRQSRVSALGGYSLEPEASRPRCSIAHSSLPESVREVIDRRSHHQSAVVHTQPARPVEIERETERETFLPHRLGMARERRWERGTIIKVDPGARDCVDLWWA